jgi:hypothetical protein
VQLKFTPLRYPFNAVKVPFHVTLLFTTVVFGVAVTAMAKSGGGPCGVTVSVSAGVAWVSVPSVPWIVKLNVSAVALPNVTANGVPAVVGVTTCGVNTHVAGAPDVQLNATVPLYPFDAVSIPFHWTF